MKKILIRSIIFSILTSCATYEKEPLDVKWVLSEDKICLNKNDFLKLSEVILQCQSKKKE